jgi:hypothetical protein
MNDAVAPDATLPGAQPALSRRTALRVGGGAAAAALATATLAPPILAQ